MRIQTIYRAFAGFALFSLTFAATMFSSGPPPGLTNAPGEQNCTQCHNGQINAGTGNVAITVVGGATTYKPDSTYEIHVKVTQASINRFGFQATVLDEAGNKAGTITLLEANATDLQASGGKDYINHKGGGTNGSGSKEWKFNWKAPATPAGKITIYATGIAANGNGQNTGDNTYSTKYDLSLAPTTVDKTLNLPMVTISPNPVTEFMQTQFTLLQKADVRLTILDLKGAELYSETLPGFTGTYNKTFEANLFPTAGVYVIKINAGAESITRKFSVIK